LAKGAGVGMMFAVAILDWLGSGVHMQRSSILPPQARGSPSIGPGTHEDPNDLRTQRGTFKPRYQPAVPSQKGDAEPFGFKVEHPHETLKRRHFPQARTHQTTAQSALRDAQNPGRFATSLLDEHIVRSKASVNEVSHDGLASSGRVFDVEPLSSASSTPSSVTSYVHGEVEVVESLQSEMVAPFASDSPPIEVYQEDSRREKEFTPAAEAVAELVVMERAAVEAGKLARVRGLSAAHQARHHRVEARSSGEVKPDADFYTRYLHQTLERKPAYPILKGFMHMVVARFPFARTWLDAGAGTCGTMEALLKFGRRAVGVELSDVSQTTCSPLHRAGLVKQGPLHKIPYPGRAFDVVFSSEVLEHVPPHLAQASVNELVRCARKDVFTTISLRPSALDKPDRPPKVHLTVRPREWWEERFRIAGCVKDQATFISFQKYDTKGEEMSPHFFPFMCHVNDKGTT